MLYVTLVWFLLAFFFLLEDQAQAQQANPPTLHLVGDSQCVGASQIAGGLSETKRWGKVEATCKGGTRTQYWVSRIDDAHLVPGDAIAVYLGSNDFGRVDAKPVLDKISAARVKSCVWVGPPLIRGQDNGAAAQIERQVAADGTCRYLDSRKLNLKLEDGVHPGPQEHRRWLKAALALIGGA